MPTASSSTVLPMASQHSVVSQLAQHQSSHGAVSRFVQHTSYGIAAAERFLLAC